MATKFKIKTGDTVKVIAGNEKGKTAVVKTVITEKNRVVLEGLNMMTKHVKPSAAKPNGGIEKVEAPLHISNIMLVDPKNGEPTKVGRKLNDKGVLQRYSKKSGDLI